MKNRKQGVAVIIVLGLLALLMVLAVSFSITMRVERAGTANYVNTVKARQLVWAGLAEAMGAINRATPGMYPDGDFLPSLASGNTSWNSTNATTGVRLMVGPAREHIPDIFLSTYGDERSEWRSMGVGEGSVAYMVLNLSDMLDANYVGGAAREGGTNVAELALAPGLMTAAELNALVAARSSEPFETLPQVKALDPNVPTDFLVTYSRYLPDTNRVDAIYIGKTVADIEQQNGSANLIARALRDLRVALGAQYRPSGTDARLMYSCLLDYVDATNITPRELNGPNGKAVPLLNEVMLATLPAPARFRLQGTNLRVEVPLFNIETWFPFFKPASEQFKVMWDQVTTLQVGANAPLVQTNSFESAAYPVTGMAASMTNEFKVHESTAPPDPSRFDVVVTTNDASFSMQLQINNMRVSLASDDSAVVDAATNAAFVVSSDNVPLNHAAGMPTQPIPFSTTTSYHVSDPRLNWLSSSWTADNAATRAAANPGQAGHRIHASNVGVLYSPLELGNLLMPRSSNPGPAWNAWDTLLVFDEGGWRDPLLETFTTDPAPDSPKRGLVNPNTPSPEILGTVLHGMPNPCIGGSLLGSDEITAVQDMFYAAQTNGTIFGNLTDVLKLDWRTALPDLSDTEREMIAAYSAGLLGVRQNLFLVLVSATTAADPGSSFFVGRQNALAVVWRDPIPNAQGLYECFVQHFQWLD